MNSQQEQTIQRLIAHAQCDRSIIGLILCGSVAAGSETDDSDIDVLVVVTDARFAQERLKKNYFWGTNFDSAQFPVEVDGKIVPKDFLRAVWSAGTEDSQSTLRTAKLLFQRDAEIAELLSGYAPPSDDEKREQIKKFYALMKSARYSADFDSDNLLHRHKCIHDTVLFACRLVLTHNDVLYPCVKNLEKALDTCADVPDRFQHYMHKLLQSYSHDDLALFYDHVDAHYAMYRFDDRLRKGYVLENELFWYFGIVPYSLI